MSTLSFLHRTSRLFKRISCYLSSKCAPPNLLPSLLACFLWPECQLDGLFVSCLDIIKVSTKMDFSISPLYHLFVAAKSYFSNPASLQADIFEFLEDQWHTHPQHIIIEVLFILFLIYFWMVPLHKAKSQPMADPPTAKERAEMIQDFKSEPFRVDHERDSTYCEETSVGHMVVQKRDQTHLFLSNQKGAPSNQVTRCLDFASFDFHSLGVNPDVIEVAKEAVRVYGVGSCGPRGFYGTVQPHLQVEQDISEFLGVEATAIISYNFATISTIIPAYSSRGDNLLVDAECHLPIQQGARLSRSNTDFFRHNDMIDLEERMIAVKRKDARKKTISRRYVVTEGIFRNTGEIAHLKTIVDLCDKHKFRLILDDSCGFGVLGKTGRGTPEHFGIPTAKICLYLGSLGNALGGIGGFCCATKPIIDFQRLQSSGYVFSASLAPYITACCSASVAILNHDPEKFANVLRKNAIAFRREIKKHKLSPLVEMIDADEDCSPLVHFRPVSSQLVANTNRCCDRLFDAVVAEMLSRNYAIRRSMYNCEERQTVVPSLRVVLKSAISEDETTRFAKVLVGVINGVFQ